MFNIEYVRISPAYGDCTNKYYLRMNSVYTLETFIDYLRVYRTDDSGLIDIWDPTFSTHLSRITYTNGQTDSDYYKPYCNYKLKVVVANGADGRMDYKCVLSHEEVIM